MRYCQGYLLPTTTWFFGSIVEDITYPVEHGETELLSN